MTQQDRRSAAGDRDLGLRRISRITWQAGIAGAACSALVAIALAHHAEASAKPAGHHSDHAAIVIPAQPPQQATGSGQVVSGAS